jgi:hypothetical protein
MKQLNVLLVSYVFPPVGGTGVMRAASLARYMPEAGIRLDVLTTRNPAAVGKDPGLLKDIPETVTIHRTLTLDLPFGLKKFIKRLLTRGGNAAPKPTNAADTKEAAAEPAKEPGLLKRLIAGLLLPDPQVTWYPILTRSARRIIRRRNIDLVLITVPPYSNLLLIEYLRKHFPNLPIVADFRDEWLSTAFEHVSFSFSSGEKAQRVATRIENAAVTSATAVVAVTEASRRTIRSRYPQLPDSKFQLIPNGYDATRLPSITGSAAQPPDSRVTLTHVGTVYSTGAPTTLVEAVNLLPPEIKSRLKLRFIGHIEEPRFRDALLALGDIVELKGFIPQKEALAAMKETDYVLLLNHDPLNVGSKFYDYVGGGKPVLGAVHPGGDTRRLLEETNAGWWAAIDDVAGIRKLLEDAVTRRDSLLQDFRPDKAKIAQYERRVLAHRYAALLRSIAGLDQPSEPQTVGAVAQESQ